MSSSGGLRPPHPRVCIAGATGWAGSELARSLATTPDLRLVAGVSRAAAGRRLEDVLAAPALACPLFASVAEALSAVPCDVLVEYTRPESAKANILSALDHGAHVVVGTSGLTDADFAEIHAAAIARQRGVLACGNFALTVVLLQRFAETAARLIPQWEIIDYAHDAKRDAPSGTARELASRLEKVRRPSPTVPVDDTVGERGARGATVSSSQVHSIRLPGYVISAEVVFGMPDQRLSLRHDSGGSAKPYVDGAQLAIRKVGGLVGLHRGLDPCWSFEARASANPVSAVVQPRTNGKLPERYLGAGLVEWLGDGIRPDGSVELELHWPYPPFGYMRLPLFDVGKGPVRRYA